MRPATLLVPLVAGAVLVVLFLAGALLCGCGGCPRTRGAHVRAETHVGASDLAITDPIVIETSPGPPLSEELDEDAVHAVVVGQEGDLRHCFEAARAEHPRLEGVVSIDVAIAADGTVRAVALATNDTGDGVLGACIVALAERWHFPSSPHGARVRVPLEATDPPPPPQTDVEVAAEAPPPPPS